VTQKYSFFILLQDDHSTGETPRRTSYRIPTTVTPRVSNEELVRRLQEAVSKPAPAISSEEAAAPRSSMERERSQLPQPRHQQERELTHIKLEPVIVKEENDLTDSSDIRSFPKTSLPKSIRSDSRFASSRGLFAHKANATDVTSGNEPALRDKTNGDRFNSVNEPKLSKRRLPTEATTDTLYKRRRAPESTFWRS
jgi:hypothetical protein